MVEVDVTMSFNFKSIGELEPTSLTAVLLLKSKENLKFNGQLLIPFTYFMVFYRKENRCISLAAIIGTERTFSFFFIFCFVLFELNYRFLSFCCSIFISPHKDPVAITLDPFW